MEGVTMRNLKGIISMAVLVALLASMLVPVTASAEPVTPASFYGTVTVDGANAAIGTVISGSVVDAEGTITVETITVKTAGSFGGKSSLDGKLVISTDNSADIGKTVEFYIKPKGSAGYFTANETSTYNYESGAQEIALTVETTEDITPPEVISTSPTNGGSTTSSSTAVKATFSESIQLIDADLITITNSTVTATPTVASAILTIPHASFSNGSYTVNIGAGAVADLAGNLLADNYTWTFTKKSSSGGGGGGGGGGGSSSSTTTTTSSGISGHSISGADGASVSIPSGVTGKNKNGLVITSTSSITLTQVVSPGAYPGNFQIGGLFFNVEPNGATFSDNITITLPYDPALVPEGSVPFISWYNSTTGTWEALVTASIDYVNHTVTAYTKHFTVFAVFTMTKETSAPTEATPSVTITTPVSPVATPTIPPSSTPVITTSTPAASSSSAAPASVPPTTPAQSNTGLIVTIIVIVVVVILVVVLVVNKNKKKSGK